jgi:hypothetical protein
MTKQSFARNSGKLDDWILVAKREGLLKLFMHYLLEAYQCDGQVVLDRSVKVGKARSVYVTFAHPRRPRLMPSPLISCEILRPFPTGKGLCIGFSETNILKLFGNCDWQRLLPQETIVMPQGRNRWHYARYPTKASITALFKEVEILRSKASQ